jgi:hypothetical protein
MNLVKHMSLAVYRIPINSSILQSTAQQLLSMARSIDDLVLFLGWSEAPEVLREGFAPARDTRELTRIIKQNQQRKVLKQKRVQRGFPDFVRPRKGFKGWLQKSIFDKKELAMPLGLNALEWIQQRWRYQLLCTLHDALLGFCASAEPRRVALEEGMEVAHPATVMLAKFDLKMAGEYQQALGQPLKALAPQALIDLFPGYVVKYDLDKGVSYYFGPAA